MRAVNARLAALKVLGHLSEAITLRRAEAVVTLTARTRDLVITSGTDPARVHVLPQPYDRETFTGHFDDPFPHVPHPRIMFVGRFSAEKGAAVLVDAFSRLRRPAHLLLIGDGRERHRIQADIRRLGIGADVSVSGFVPHRTAAAAMAHAHVVVLPSLFEEAGTVAVEAMALGVPLVASDVGGIRQTAANGKAALFVSPGDPVALAAALDEVLGRPELASRLATAGRSEAAGRDRGRTGERMLGIYREVVTAPPAP
ncbi:glycosyltransferase [Streptomyces sp. NPDC002640]